MSKSNQASKPEAGFVPPLVVCSVETGDLFRVFPSGRVTEIPCEDDLRDPKALGALDERHALKLTEEQGDAFWLVTFYKCRECRGSGALDKYNRRGESWIEECEDCYGTGWLYSFTDEIVTREEIERMGRAA